MYAGIVLMIKLNPLFSSPLLFLVLLLHLLLLTRLIVLIYLILVKGKVTTVARLHLRPFFLALDWGGWIWDNKIPMRRSLFSKSVGL